MKVRKEYEEIDVKRKKERKKEEFEWKIMKEKYYHTELWWKIAK